ncbi:MAG: DUF6165 family protein [Devosia sp.]
MQLMVEVSVGEVIDKVTILELKLQNMSDAAKLANVRTELDTLNGSLQGVADNVELARLKAELFAVNAALWVIEDDIRLCEARGDFGPRFVALARSVYVTNDKRATIKKQINLAVGSRLIEEKSYAGSL